MRQQLKFGLLFILLTLPAQFSLAAGTVPINIRLTAGNLNVNPKVLNTELTTQSLNEIKSVSIFGLEATHTAFAYLDYGLRFTARMATKQELVDDPVTDYHGALSQSSALFIARVPLFKTPHIRFDIFGGGGGSNTKFALKTVSQNGEFSRAESADWFATPYASYGASMAFGANNYHFVVEGGYESNKVEKLKTTGTVTSSISEIDMTGTYVSIGILMEGIPGYQK